MGEAQSAESELLRDGNHSPKQGMDPSEGSLPGGKKAKILGTKSWDQLNSKDIFIAVKTTRKYHRSRLELLIQTWVSQAKEQVSRVGGI